MAQTVGKRQPTRADTARLSDTFSDVETGSRSGVSPAAVEVSGIDRLSTATGGVGEDAASAGQSAGRPGPVGWGCHHRRRGEGEGGTCRWPRVEVHTDTLAVVGWVAAAVPFEVQNVAENGEDSGHVVRVADHPQRHRPVSRVGQITAGRCAVRRGVAAVG